MLLFSLDLAAVASRYLMLCPPGGETDTASLSAGISGFPKPEARDMKGLAK
jgi:hypothetical protein